MWVTGGTFGDAELGLKSIPCSPKELIFNAGKTKGNLRGKESHKKVIFTHYLNYFFIHLVTHPFIHLSIH